LQRRSVTPDPTAPALTPRQVKPTHHLRRPSPPVSLHQRGAHHVGVGYEVTRRRTPDINTENNRDGVGGYAAPVSVSPHLPRLPPRAQYLHASGNSPQVWGGYGETTRQCTCLPSATTAVVPSTPTSTRNPPCGCWG
ncbi:hypothetical protein GALMADRAFT_256239, partial [Galerina marginata CBS 339.88]